MKKTDYGYDKVLAEMQKVWGADQHMVDYCVKEITRIIDLDNGEFIAFNKPSKPWNEILQGYSCIGQGTPYTEVWGIVKQIQSNLEEAFINYNLRMNNEHYDYMIEDLKDKRKKLYKSTRFYRGEKGKHWVCDFEYNARGEWEPLDEKYRKEILKAVEAEREAFIKRLRTYFKKYSDKIYVRTYCMDD